MRNQQVYGKRNTARERLTDQCFAGSSSPFKEEARSPVRRPERLSLVIRQTDDSVVESQLITTTQILERDEALDEAITGLKGLKLNHGELVKPKRRSGQRNDYDGSVVLRSRDANAVPKRTQTVWQGTKKRFSDAAVNETDTRLIPNVKLIESQRTLDAAAQEAEVQNVGKPIANKTFRNRKVARETSTKPLRADSLSLAHEHSNRTRHPLVAVNEDSPDITTYIQPLLELCSDPEARLAPTHFQTWADSLSTFFKISKIAEASYGEVYRLSLKSSNARFSSNDESVLKIIALKQPPRPRTNSTSVNGRNNSSGKSRESRKQFMMSAIDDVASEVRLLERMSLVPGWTNFREFHLMQGRPPTQLVDAWKDFNQNVKKSLFPHPGRKTSYKADQLWAVVEMQDAGTDLETMMEKQETKGFMANVEVIWDVFWGVACAVAYGEEYASFEHRDLHLGNICVRKPTWEVVHAPPTKKLGFTSLETTIIDYTLSRASMSGQNSTKPDQIAYFDLSKDPAIFAGDGTEEYQYDMYRFMHSAVTYGDPTVEYVAPIQRKVNKAKSQKTSQNYRDANVWRQYHPRTNLIWLHFVLHTLLGHRNNISTASEPSLAATMTGFLDHDRRVELDRQLQELSEKIEIGALKSNGFDRAADLVAWAVEEGWLNETDIISAGGCAEEGAVLESVNLAVGEAMPKTTKRGVRGRKRKEA